MLLPSLSTTGSILVLSVLAACGAPRASDAPVGATNAPARPALAPPDHAALEARLVAQVRWLADDAREGRRAGTKGATDAGAWIAAELATIGLAPAGDDGWFQAFRVPLDARDGGRSTLRWPMDGAGAVTQPATPLFCSAGGNAKGELLWCGYGIEDEERGWNDFAEKELTGRIAVVVRGTPDVAPPKLPEAAPNPHGGAPADPWGNGGSVFTKVMNAKRRGAVGVVLVPETETEGLLAFDAGHGARAGIPCVAVDFFGAMQLSMSFYSMPVGELGRPPAVLPPSKQAIELHADVVREEGPATNVIGRLRGRDSSRCVVVGAHYDHLGHGGAGSLAPNESGNIHNGADDNASGTAAVIEIARALVASGTPECDVLFALWSGEELGLLGSEYWAQHPTVPFERVSAKLNLDMVGRAGNGKLQVLGAGSSSAFASWMGPAGKSAGLELAVNLAGGALGGSSDHQTFLKRGVPALHLFSGLHADYHKPSDDADKFEAAGTARVVALGTDFVRRMTAAKELDFVEAKSPVGERQTPTGGFRVRLGSIPNYAYDGKGVLIDGASQGSPAERAGLIRGDVLTKLGDVVLDSVHDLTYALSHFKPGDVVVLEFTREGAKQSTRVTLVAPAGDVR